MWGWGGQESGVEISVTVTSSHWFVQKAQPVRKFKKSQGLTIFKSHLPTYAGKSHFAYTAA